MLCEQCSPSFKALVRLKAYKSRDRMRANELPQREELRSLCKNTSEELLFYDKELVRLRFLVRYVQSQKQELEHEAALLESLNAPIRLLPPEVLGNVFKYYVEAAGGNQFSYGPKAIVPVAILAAVCKHWHTIAFHSPSLWCRISVRFGSEYPTELSYLSTIVGRSITTRGSRTPLRIHMSSEKGPLFERNDHDIPMLQAITKECDRWLTLLSDIDGDFAMSEPLQQTKDHLDQLWCLDIRQRAVRGKTLSMFSKVPKLQMLHFDVLHQMSLVDIPLSQINTMSVRLWEGVNLVTELTPCKNVTNLTVNLAEDFFAYPLEVPRFVLKCKGLTVDASDHSAPRNSERRFFAGIRCPNLEAMILLERNDSRSTMPFSISELHPFLVASGQKLRTLHIATFPLDDVDDLITAFTAMPLLENLYVTEGCPPCCPNCSGTVGFLGLEREDCLGRSILNADFLRALTVTRSDRFTINAQVVLPNLKTLLLGASRIQGDFEFSLLADMLYSRYFVNEGLVKLEKVNLTFPDMSTKASDIDLFRWLCEVGVDLTVHDRDRRVI